MVDLQFKYDNISVTPSKTYLVRVSDDGKTKCLGTFSDKKEAYEVSRKFKEDRLKRVCKEYGHEIEDGVIVQTHYILFDNSDVFVIDTAHKLQPCLNGAGYFWVRLNGNIFRLHRLVAENFIPKIPGKYYVNHKDGNKLNNRVDNLEWCTSSENAKHAFDMGLRTGTTPKGEDCPWSKLTEKDVQRIRESYIPRDKHYNQYELSKKYGVSQQMISKIIRNKRWGRENVPVKSKPFLYDFQMDAVNRMRNGCILCGGVGSGKSRTSLFYYFKENGGWIDEYGYKQMKPKPQDLIIISTAQKRNLGEWEEELHHFRMSTDPKKNPFYSHTITIDSWNNIKKYQDVTGAFFIFDEDRLTGKGAWVKAFLKIAKHNNWIVLSATPADVWMDFVPIFIANGFYKNRTEFNNRHVKFSRFAKYPKIDGYYNEETLCMYRDMILVDMDFQRKTTRHHEDIFCNYDIAKYRDIMRNRWDYYKNEPIMQASGLCYALRRIVNSDESRQVALLELLEQHPKAIIFYSYDYELEILKSISYIEGTEIAEYNGHKHDPLPTGDRWVYLVNYASGNAGWNCTTTNCIIFYSQNYSYKIMEQSAGRVDRLNTPFKDLYYYHLRSRSGIDLAISRALREKKKFNERKFTKWE